MPEMIDFVLTKKVNNVIYELMVKTTTNMVYTPEGYTLTEMLNDVLNRISGIEESTNNKLSEVTKQISGMDNMIMELREYYANQENSILQITKALKNDYLKKSDLSEDVVETLKGVYSKTDIDTMIQSINKKIDDIVVKDQIVAGTSEEPPESLIDGGIYCYITSK